MGAGGRTASDSLVRDAHPQRILFIWLMKAIDGPGGSDTAAVAPAFLLDGRVCEGVRRACCLDAIRWHSALLLPLCRRDVHTAQFTLSQQARPHLHRSHRHREESCAVRIEGCTLCDVLPLSGDEHMFVRTSPINSIAMGRSRSRSRSYSPARGDRDRDEPRGGSDRGGSRGGNREPPKQCSLLIRNLSRSVT